jgi:DNA-binding MarR family transcriptional regulator
MFGVPTTSSSGPPAPGVAFLLAQLGAHAASRFGERMAEHDLSAPQAGILRTLASQPGPSQQELAEALGLLPSRVVAFVDELETAGLVVRARDAGDRRRNTLLLTPAGRSALATIARAGKEHERELTAGLSSPERAQLLELLRRIADEQGLIAGVHPGYRDITSLR